MIDPVQVEIAAARAKYFITDDQGTRVVELEPIVFRDLPLDEDDS